MQVGVAAGGVAGVADPSDRLAGPHRPRRPDGRRHVRPVDLPAGGRGQRERGSPEVVPTEHHRARRRGADRGAPRGEDVGALVEPSAVVTGEAPVVHERRSRDRAPEIGSDRPRRARPARTTGRGSGPGRSRDDDGVAGQDQAPGGHVVRLQQRGERHAVVLGDPREGVALFHRVATARRRARRPGISTARGGAVRGSAAIRTVDDQAGPAVQLVVDDPVGGSDRVGGHPVAAGDAGDGVAGAHDVGASAGRCARRGPRGLRSCRRCCGRARPLGPLRRAGASDRSGRGAIGCRSGGRDGPRGRDQESTGGHSGGEEVSQNSGAHASRSARSAPT